MPNFALPDGRLLTVERAQDEGYWHLQLQDEPPTEIVGTPLQSTLAELLGYRVSQEEWPSWIDDLATEIERSL